MERPASPAVVFARGAWLYAVAVDGSRTVRLTRIGLYADFALSRDGRWIAYDGLRGAVSELWTMRLDGTRRTRIASSRSGLGDPDWAPDNRTIVFSHYFVGNRFGATCGSLFRIDREGREMRRLTDATAQFHSHQEPSVSRDGQRIAFTDENGCEGGTTYYAVRVIDSTGQPTNDLARLTGNDYIGQQYKSPTWSPDSSRMALHGDGLVVVRRDGTGLRRLTPRGLRPREPAWSPDGRWIAFIGRYDDRPTYLYVVRPNGTGLRRLSPARAIGSPSWLATWPTVRN